MKTIFIHAGTHKTGTTAFQAFAREHSAILAANGIYTPPSGEKYDSVAGGLHSIPMAIEYQCGSRAKPVGPKNKHLSDFLEAFEASGLPSALISSEGFSRFGEAEVAALKASLSGYRVRAVLVFRHPISYMTALYCSAGAIKRRVDVWHFLRKAATQYRVQYGTIAKLWLSAFPSSVILRYEDHKSIVEPLLQSIDLNPAVAVPSSGRARRSLPIDLALLNYELSKTLKLDDATHEKHIYANILRMMDFEDYLKAAPEGRLIPVNVERQRQILSLLAAETNELAATAGWQENTFAIPIAGDVVTQSRIDSLKNLFVQRFIEGARVDYTAA